MKKIKKKVIATILLILTLLSNVLPIIPSVVSLAANNNDIGTVLNIVSIGTVPYHLKSTATASGGYVITHLAGYYDNGTFYPAYCLQRELTGAGDDFSYDVTITDILADTETYNKIWRVATAGYPYKSASDLGVSDWQYAYQATKMAIYCVLGQADVNSFYASDTTGQEIVNAIKYLVNIGENGTDTYRTPVGTINKSGDMTLSGNYYIQNYTLTANVSITSYDIATTGFPNGTLITDTSGTQKTTFSSGETFQLRIPKDSVETGDINGRIRATVTSTSYAVFYSSSYDEALQDYAITGDPIALTSTSTDVSLKGNTASIKVKKVDVDTGESISDTTFQLTKDDGTVIGTKTTDSNGNVTFTGLYQGNYVIKEITSNDNYVLMQETIDISALYNQTSEITIENEHKKGNIKVYKVDKDNNKVVLGNVEFQLYSYEFDKVIGTYNTDVNGEIYIENLRTGNYALIETNTNKWYNLAEDTEVKVEWNTTTETTIENELKKGQIKVIKVDLDNNEVLLEGVMFEVLDSNGNVLETITTDSNGEAVTNKYAVRDFESLTLRETETLENYVLTEETQTIELEANEIKTVTFENEKKKGQIRVIKVDMDDNEVKLEGVEFNVYDESGNIVDTLVTDENGEAVSKRLPIDQNYTVQETKTGEWYVLTEETQTVTLEQDQITDLTFENEKKKGQIKVIKVDEDNNEVLLEGVTFNILDEDDNVVDTIVTDSNGEAVTKRLPIDQEYTAVEVETRKEYVLTEETQTVTLEQDEITTLTFENEKIKGQVEITKVSADDNELTGEEKGTPLANAVFEIYTENDELVERMTTNEEGKAISGLLEYGHYYIKEVDSGSEEYLLNTEKFEFDITENKEIIPITIENTSVDIGLEIDKNGVVQAQANDEIKYSFETLKNTSNVSLDNFTWTDNLPYEYVRITKLFTGTYNENLDYVVKYKTNKSEDYIEYGTYNTQTNNYIDFTTVELDDDEYITDFKVEFGTVMSGFEAVEKPFIFAKVLPTVTGDDKWTNYTTLTGNYNEYELEDKAEWTTISYEKKLTITKLPKTGF